MPGITPLINRAPIDTPVATPNVTNNTLGGIRGPSAPAVAVSAVANFLS